MHRTHVGLVHDRAARRLERDGKAHLRREVGRVIGRRDPLERRAGDPEARAQLHGPVGVEPHGSVAAVERLGDESTGPVDVDAGKGGNRPDGAAEPLRMLGRARQRGGGRLRKGERRDLPLIRPNGRVRLVDALTAEEARDDRLVAGGGGARVDRTRDIIGPGHEGRDEDHDECVDARIREHRAHRLLVHARAGRGDEVDRVPHAGVR